MAIETMLLESDRERMQHLMENVMETRAQRPEPPVRDEAKIASILRDAETRADTQHQLLVASQSLNSGVGTKLQTPVDRSYNLRIFTEMLAWRRRFTGADKEDPGSIFA